MYPKADQKSVILFGAGAVLDWGGPLTLCSGDSYTKIHDHNTDKINDRPCCLTHLLLVSGFKTKDGDFITQRIFDHLKNSSSATNVNFETILNVIEDLYAYWYARTSKNKNNIYALLELDETLADLHYFIKTNDQLPHQYKFTVPGFCLYENEIVSIEMDTHVKYYELFLNELLSAIIGTVLKYAYASQTHKAFENEVNKVNNTNFKHWIKSFTGQGKQVRMYTLNYDDIFKQMVEQDGLEVFDGFYRNSNPSQGNLAADLKSIVIDTKITCHYNLHGTTFWTVEELNKSQFPGYSYLKGLPGGVNNSVASIEIEKGKRLLLSNIISGYQKVQKTAISPFRQFFSAFDRDCLEAVELYIIGYSYGDEHVNDIIRNARRCNPDLRITLINPDFDDLKFGLDFLSNWGELSSDLYQNMTDSTTFSKTFNVLILKEKFSNFLAAFNAGTTGSYW